MSEIYTPIPPVRQFSSNESVTITYVDPSGDEHPVTAEVGQHLLDVAHNNNIELEGTSTKMQSSLFIYMQYYFDKHVIWHRVSKEHVGENLHVQRVTSFSIKTIMILCHQNLMKKRICWT